MTRVAFHPRRRGRSPKLVGDRLRKGTATSSQQAAKPFTLKLILVAALLGCDSVVSAEGSATRVLADRKRVHPESHLPRPNVREGNLPAESQVVRGYGWMTHF